MSENTEIVAVDASILDGNTNRSICTVDLSDDMGKLKIIAALNYAAPLKDFADKEIIFCDCIQVAGVRKARNGGTDTPCKNTYLIDADGNAYFSQSDGIARSVQMISALFPDFGKHLDDGGIKLKLVEQKLPNGNTLKNLVPVQ